MTSKADRNTNYESPALSIGECVCLACTLEVTAPKAGNVYPGHEFADLKVQDFLAAAAVCASTFEPNDARPGLLRVGASVLDCVERSRRVTESNANLGIVLLLSPLAIAASRCINRDLQTLRAAVAEVLDDLNAQDGADVFAAIRLAGAGGLGEADELDVNTTRDVDLMEAMRLSASHDSIAQQYATEFASVFESVVPVLAEATTGKSLLDGIRWAQIRLLAEASDSLIQRKCGAEFANDVKRRAASVREGSHDDWLDFDQWLRADGNRRNPGTTADLIAAGLFVLLFCGVVQLSDR